MQVSVQEAAVLVTAIGVGIGIMTYALTKRRDRMTELRQAEQAAREEGARREQLASLSDDVENFKTVQIPRINQLERIQEGNTVAIKGLADQAQRTSEQIAALAELEGERSKSIDRLVDHLIDQHTPLKGA